MGLLDKLKADKNMQKTNDISDYRKEYGAAWIKIADFNQHEQGLAEMKLLSEKGFSEASVAFSMFTNDSNEKRKL